ncbi:MAG TPA: hypothetical protein VIU16_07235, partial [Gaiellaceae bacterium]
MSSTLASEFGGKTAGQLIRAQDWNDLVDAVDALNASLTGELNELKTDTEARLAADEAALSETKATVDDLTATVTSLKDELTALTELLADYYRLDLSTARAAYATGEQATISVQLNDLHDQPVTFADADRPWVDFFTV